MRELAIGDVAARSDHTVSALRFYDQLGLLGDMPRRAGARRFPSTVLRRLALIRAAQEAGFTLAEIKLLLDQRPEASVRQQWETLATRRLPELDALIDRLNRLRETVANCLSCGCLSLTTCAMLQSPATTDTEPRLAGPSRPNNAPVDDPPVRPESRP